MYDLIIIGAGPAGLTAGLYAARSGLKTCVISRNIGGTVNFIKKIENWPGFIGSGAGLMKNFHDQLKKYEIEFLIDSVENIQNQKDFFLVKTQNNNINARTIILATGMSRIKMKIPGEKKFKGKGVSYCATCDGFFFKGQTVAVTGESPELMSSALELSKNAKKVYVICKKNIKVNNSDKNIEVINSEIKEIFGNEIVKGVIIKEGSKERKIKLDGVFIENGDISLMQFAGNLGLEINKEGHIIVDGKMKTSVAGIFAAGDVTDSEMKQVIIASSQGAIAAKSAYSCLTKAPHIRHLT
jgi:thioredoxin reductase (NADPH)